MLNTRLKRLLFVILMTSFIVGISLFAQSDICRTFLSFDYIPIVSELALIVAAVYLGILGIMAATAISMIFVCGAMIYSWVMHG